MKLKTILISAFASVAAIGAIGTTSALLLRSNNTESFSNLSNNFNSVDTNSHNNPFSVNTEFFGGNFNFTIQRHSSSEVSSVASQESKTYTIKISDDSKTTDAEIFFLDETGKETKEATFSPGSDIKVTVKFSEEKQKTAEKLTVRDLFVSGVNKNHFVKTEKQNDTTYIIKMPQEKNALNMDGTSWLYKEGTQIDVKATYIKESIGENTKWTHGAFFDLNGYVHKLDKDVTWSTIKEKIYTTFDNSTDKTNPIDVYVYLNGHTLTIDEKIEDKYLPSGWALHIYNSDKDSSFKLDESVTAGKVIGVDQNSTITIKGSLHLGRNVTYNAVHTEDGIRFLPEKADSSWTGILANKGIEKESKK